MKKHILSMIMLLGSVSISTPISAYSSNKKQAAMPSNPLNEQQTLFVKQISVDDEACIAFEIGQVKPEINITWETIDDAYELKNVKLFVQKDYGNSYINFVPFLEMYPNYLQSIDLCFPTFSVKGMKNFTDGTSGSINLSDVNIEYELVNRIDSKTSYLYVMSQARYYELCATGKLSDENIVSNAYDLGYRDGISKTDSFKDGYQNGYELGFERGQNADCWWHSMINWFKGMWESLAKRWNNLFN